MTFLAIDSQKNLFTLQKSQLQFEQTLVMNQANWLAKEMSARAEQLEAASGNGQVDLDNDAYYVSLQKQEEYLTTRQNTLDTQISLLDNEISSMKTMVQNNIKSSCSLNLIGGWVLRT